MNYDIRPAVAEDLHVVSDIVRAAYTHYIPRLGRAPTPMLDDHAARILQQQVSVAGPEGSILGCMVLVPESEGMFLSSMAVTPVAQGRGLGRALLAYAELAALRAGFSAIRVSLHEAMTESLAMYQRRGFALTQRREQDGLFRVHLQKILSPMWNAQAVAYAPAP